VLSGVVYARDHGDERLEFGAVGAENGVLVLYDRPTRSRWSQVAGRAVAGPLTGTRLRRLPSLVTTWSRWQILHPDTTVYVDEEPPARRPRFNEETVSRVALGVEGPVRNEDWVVALEGRAASRAFLVRRLVETRLAHEVFEGQPIVAFLTEDFTTATVWEPTVDGRALTFTAEGDRLRDTETGSAWAAVSGKTVAGPLAGRALVRVPGSSALWYAWKAQFPDTGVYGEPGR